MSELKDMQWRFSRMIGNLLLWLGSHGYEVQQGEGWRTPEQAALNAAKGIGIKNSLHCDRLAHDLIVSRSDTKQALTPAEYEPIGIEWERLGGSWGGRFGDPQHFSLAYGGRR